MLPWLESTSKTYDSSLNGGHETITVEFERFFGRGGIFHSEVPTSNIHEY
jgi:hypothetical protein